MEVTTKAEITEVTVPSLSYTTLNAQKLERALRELFAGGTCWRFETDNHVGGEATYTFNQTDKSVVITF